MSEGLFYVMAHPRALNPILNTWLPRLMILLLPIVAAILALLNRGRRLHFVDHLSFVLHGQAFSFLLLGGAILVRALDPDMPHVATAVLAIPLFYTLIAFRRVYGGGWIAAILKITVIGAIFGSLLAGGLLAILLYGVANVV
jgi:hypothetical protein